MINFSIIAIDVGFAKKKRNAIDIIRRRQFYLPLQNVDARSIISTRFREKDRFTRRKEEKKEQRRDAGNRRDINHAAVSLNLSPTGKASCHFTFIYIYIYF